MGLQIFKQKLEQEKNDILSELKKHKEVPDFGSDVDVDEETDESGAFGNELSIFQTYKNRLADIESALKKIEEKKYGICENCKKEISPDLLSVDPESRLCQECKLMK